MIRTILLADDEEAVRALVAETIRDDSRYRLLEAKNGKEAIAMARQETPDLVILDAVMPICDGFEACRQIKSDPGTRSTTVIMLTALAQDSYQEKGKKAGADGYLTKPFSPSALLHIVDHVLSR